MDELKSRFDTLLNFVSQVEYSRKHPIRIVQACKSIIGINPENPPQVLLKWLERYLKDFSPKYDKPEICNSKTSPEVIAYSHLNNFIKENNQRESHDYLGHLLQMANPNHIAEYLIEIAASTSPGSLLFCWAAMRSILFSGAKDAYYMLYHCISRLLDEKGGKDSNGTALERYEICCHQYQIRKYEMVRRVKIIYYFDQLIETTKSQFIQSEFPDIPEILKTMIDQEGVYGIHTYLYEIRSQQISIELVLLLDALRSILKFSDLSNEEIYSGIFLKKC